MDLRVDVGGLKCDINGKCLMGRLTMKAMEATKGEVQIEYGRIAYVALLIAIPKLIV